MFLFMRFHLKTLFPKYMFIYLQKSSDSLTTQFLFTKDQQETNHCDRWESEKLSPHLYVFV